MGERHSSIAYEELFDVLTACIKEHSPKDFAIQAFHKLSNLCRYDQGLIFFIDANMKPYDLYLWKIEPYWANLYLEYYDKLHNAPYSISQNRWPDKRNLTEVQVDEWRNISTTDEFMNDYIHARGLKYSMCVLLHDLESTPRAIIGMERTEDIAYTQNEILNMNLIATIFDNIYKNFFTTKRNQFATRQTLTKKAIKLTSRETQIANLLCQGVSPLNVSKMLNIALSTTYKHISNIYDKLNVSSMQELITRYNRG